jgi:hypothetical protein
MITKLATLILCVWLTGTAAMWWVATENFRTVDRLLQTAPVNPLLAQKIERLAPGDARMVLRHLASELNRYYFRAWNWIQLLLGGIVFGLLLGRGRQQQFSRSAIVGMLMIVIAFVIYFTPTIIALGRSLDFVPRQPPPPGFAKFWQLHMTYMALDLFKLGLGLWVMVRLIQTEGIQHQA